jgi:glycogen(starch) synthase
MFIKTVQLGLEWFPERGGGLDRFYFDLVHALPSVDVQCRGLIAGSGRAAAETGGTVRAFAEPAESLLTRWRGVRRGVRQILADWPADLVAAHFAVHVFPVLRMIRHLPLVVHFQGPWAAESRLEGGGRVSSSIKESVERAVYSRAQRLIVLSSAFAKILREQYGVSADRVRVVPGGVNVARFAAAPERADARHRLGWPSGRPTVLAVRRLVRRVGLEDLIAATDQLRRHMPDVLVLIAGKGPLHATLQQQIHQLNLGQHVRLLGFVPDDDLPAAYRAADLTVVPTVALEGFGLVVAESLAAGTPSLVTPVGSLPEVVQQLSEDLVLPSVGARSLADGMRRILQGSGNVPTPAECHAYAAARFDWSVIAKRVRSVYGEALSS